MFDVPVSDPAEALVCKYGREERLKISLFD
jgi:hypothetical protein